MNFNHPTGCSCDICRHHRPATAAKLHAQDCTCPSCEMHRELAGWPPPRRAHRTSYPGEVRDEPGLVPAKPAPTSKRRRGRLVDRMTHERLAGLKTWEGWAVFSHGLPLPGCLGDNESSCWAKVRNHPAQSADDLRSLGFEVYPVTISVRRT